MLEEVARYDGIKLLRFDKFANRWCCNQYSDRNWDITTFFGELSELFDNSFEFPYN